MKELPALIDKLSIDWDFQFIKSMPNLSYNFVGLVKLRASDEYAIIKIIPE